MCFGASHVHHPESFLVVRWTLYLRRGRKRRGRHCVVEQCEAVATVYVRGIPSVSSATRKLTRHSNSGCFLDRDNFLRLRALRGKLAQREAFLVGKKKSDGN